MNASLLHKFMLMILLVLLLSTSTSQVLASNSSVNIGSLLERLLNINFLISSEAGNLLVEIGEPIVQVLGETMMKEKNAMNRLKIVNVLRKIDSEQSVEYLVHALTDSEAVVRNAALDALANYGSAASEQVGQLLFSISYNTRTSAYKALLALGYSPEDICFYVKDYLFSSDLQKREIVLWLLKEMASDATTMVPVLTSILKNEAEPYVIRLAVLEVLYKIQPSVIEASDWAMAINSLTIKNFERLFWMANDNLLKIGKQGIPEILPLLDAPDAATRLYAINLLNKIITADDKRQEILNEFLLDDKWYVGQAVAEGLGQGLILRSVKDGHDSKVQVIESRDSITLDNGIVRLGINKTTGVVNSLQAYGHNLLGAGGRIYYDTITNPGGTWWPAPSKYEIVHNDTEMAHIVFSKPATREQPLGVDLNFVLRQGDSGYYFFAVYHHDIDFAVDFVQARNVIRFDENLLKYKAIDDFKMGRMPTNELWDNGEEVMDATQRLADGSVYSKYNWQVYEGDHQLHGIMGDNIGLWMISASREYLNGGPFKQNRTVHHRDVLLQIMQSGHFGAGGHSFTANSDWEKIYGPHFIYVNQGDDLAELWMDAKVQAKFEASQWPYQWVDHQIYPIERSTVKGKIKLTDNSNLANAWVILTSSGAHWQHQGKGYQFWARTDASGNFEISNVRSGEYNLYINLPGVLGEYTVNNILVEAPFSLDLGELNWTPKQHGDLLWEIGIPDRSGAEFYISGNDYRNWGLWFDYPRNFPNGVIFKIGESDYSVDWNHYQPIVIAEGDQEVPADPWQILFELEQVVQGQGFLTVAIAGSTENNVLVRLNGETIGLISRSNDNTVYRSAIRGIYGEYVFQFDSSLLKSGENVVTLEVTGNRGLHRGIIYDYLRMEIEHNY